MNWDPYEMLAPQERKLAYFSTMLALVVDFQEKQCE